MTDLPTLERRIARLERVVEGEAELTFPEFTGLERRIFAVLLRRSVSSIDELTDAAYANRCDGGPDNADRVVRGMVWRIRRKIKAHGLAVKTHYGLGYELQIDGEDDGRRTHL